MNGTCKRPDCDISSGIGCEMGVPDFTTCKHYQAAPPSAIPAETTSEQSDDISGLRLPWSGRGLGLADIILASSRGSARLVGLIGPFNAGKTGLLTAIFSHFSMEGTIDGHEFAGSFSLQGWNQLKDHTTWPSSTGGMFPPHTPDTADRVPSLLHLAFRRETAAIRDVLFTDAPGEWFTRWVLNENAENAAGARWIAEYATHFIFVVDRGGLGGPEVGRVRQTTLSLARRLSENRRGRPIIVVWTKSDEHCDEEAEAFVRTRLVQLFGQFPSLELHVQDPKCVEILKMVLDDFPHKPAQPSSLKTTSPFLAYGGVSND